MLRGGEEPPVWVEPEAPLEPAQEGDAAKEGEEMEVEYKELSDGYNTAEGRQTEIGDENIVVEQRRSGLWGWVRGMFRR